MNFCSHCGSDQLEMRIPDGDHRLRYVCLQCKTIHYTNPNMVVGCIVEKEGRVLLAKRGINPRLGYWNLPCGFLENGETIQEGAVREVFEETGVKVRLGHLHTVYNLIHARQVYLIFTAEMIGEHFETTPESTEIAFFDENTVPWEEMAFSSNTFALEKYFKADLSEQQTYIGPYRKSDNED